MEVVIHGKWQKTEAGYQLVPKPFKLKDGSEVVAQTPYITDTDQIPEAEEAIASLYSSVMNISIEEALESVHKLETPHVREYIESEGGKTSYGIVSINGINSLAVSVPEIDRLSAKKKKGVIKAAGMFMSRTDKKELSNL